MICRDEEHPGSINLHQSHPQVPHVCVVWRLPMHMARLEPNANIATCSYAKAMTLCRN